MKPVARQIWTLVAGAGGVLLVRFIVNQILALEPVAGTEMASILSMFVRFGSIFAAVSIMAMAVWLVLVTRPQREVGQ